MNHPVADDRLQALISQAMGVLAQLEAWLPPAPPAIDWTAHAYRWQRRGARGWLEAVRRIAPIHLQDLHHVHRQKAILERNTLAFLDGRPANNVLMTGARGTGKSSLVRALLDAYADRGLRLIEIDKSDLGIWARSSNSFTAARNAISCSATTCPSKKARPATKH